jgi:heme a synthase
MPQLGIFHAALAQLYLVLVAAIALFTSRWWREAPDSSADVSSLRRWYMVMASLIFVQLVVAATMRHEHAGLAITDFPLAYGQVWPDTSAPAIAHYNELRVGTLNPAVNAFQIVLQMTHRVLALVILGLVLAAAWKTKMALGWKEKLTRLSLVQVGLILVQVTLGAATIWTNKSADVTTAHVAVGALSFLNSVMLVLVASRGLAVHTVYNPKTSKPEAGLRRSGVVPA